MSEDNNEKVSKGEEGVSREVLQGIEGELLRELARMPRIAVESASRPVPGTCLGAGERFQIIEEIGSGGMARIYRARDRVLGREIAVKLVDLGLHDESRREALLALFEAEMKKTARLQHEHLVVLHEVGRWKGRPFMILEYLRGLDLGARIAKGSLPVEEALRIASEVLEALVCAHRGGIIHRDLKPDNVFLVEGAHVKVLDFGLAAVDPERLEGLASADALRSLGDSPPGGTPAYMAPEQWREDTPSPAVDLWAVGMILFEMLAGARPFSGCEGILSSSPAPSVKDFRQEVAEPVRALIAQALDKDPAGRPESAAAMLSTLRGAMGSVFEVEGEPYRYLEAFGERDAPWFFGRRRACARLSVMVDARPLVMVSGPSGAGKSSLVCAGLVAGWRRSHRAGRVLMMTPGRAPLVRLHERMREAGVEPGVSEAIWRSHPGLVGETLRRAALKSGGQVLVVVDQLEEIFTICEEGSSRRAFAEALCAVADDVGGPLRVVLTMRADFLGRLIQTPRLEGLALSNLMLVGSPAKEALAEALVEPARRLGVEMSPELVESVLASLRDEEAPLPLLQLTASRLWAGRAEGVERLEVSALEALGGVEGLLAHHADEVVGGLGSEAEVAVARELLCALVTEVGTRRSMSRTDLQVRFGHRPELSSVLGHLVSGRLIVTGRASLELAHETLIQRWGALSGWLREDASALRFRARVSESAGRWAAEGRPEGLLWDGEVLLGALERRPGGLGPVEAAFLEAGRAKVERRARVRRVGGVVIVALAVVSTLVAIISGVMWRRALEAEGRATASAQTAQAQRVEADRQRDKAQAASKTASSRALAAQAIEALHDDHMLGLLLAREAWRVAETPEAVSALREALGVSREVAVLAHGDSDVSVARFGPGGQRVVTGSWDAQARVWGLDGRLEAVLKGHLDALDEAVFSPGGRFILTTSSGLRGDKSARLWRRDGRLVKVLEGHGAAVTGGLFHPDGARLLSFSMDGTARLWNLDGEVLAVIRGAAGPLTCAAFDPSGEVLAVGSEAGPIGLWDLSGRSLAALEGHTQNVWGVSFSPDGQRILSFSSDKTARLWDRRGGVVAVLGGHTQSLSAGRFSPDGRWILTASWDRTARLWTAVGKQVAVLRGHSDSVVGARFHPGGERVLTASHDHSARLWDLEGRPLAVLRGHKDDLWGATFSPDGALIATASADGTARLWRNEGGEGGVLRGHDDAVAAATFSPDGQRVLTTSWDGSARVWDLSGRALWSFETGESRPLAAFSPDGQRVLTVSSAPSPPLMRISGLRGEEAVSLEVEGSRLTRGVFSPDGQRVLAAATDNTGRLFGVGGEPLGVLRGHRGPLSAVVFSPDGALMLTASLDKTARVWRGGAHAVLSGHEERVISADFNPDGTQVVTASWDDTARIYGVDGAHIAQLVGHGGSLTSAVFSPDGERVLTASDDRTARLWDLSGRMLVSFAGHEDKVTSATFSPDGQRVLTVSWDQSVRLWDVGGRLLTVVRAHGGPVHGASFSPDGRRFVTAGGDRSARLHLTRSGDLVAQAESRITRALTPEERVRFGLPVPAR